VKTHAVLWFYLADPQLSAAASAAIIDPANEETINTLSDMTGRMRSSALEV